MIYLFSHLKAISSECIFISWYLLYKFSILCQKIFLVSSNHYWLHSLTYTGSFPAQLYLNKATNTYYLIFKNRIQNPSIILYHNMLPMILLRDFNVFFRHMFTGLNIHNIFQLLLLACFLFLIKAVFLFCVKSVLWSIG